MILSILIPTLPERKDQLYPLATALVENAFHENQSQFEILSDGRGREVTTGQKRNNLIERAKGKYIVFLDDDDEVPEYYVNEIIEAAKSDPDVITFNGYMTTDGEKRTDFELRVGHPYVASTRNGKEIYLRFPNHIVPMKRDLVKDIKFPHITLGEDYAWAKQINDLGILKTEVVIAKDMYHYKFISKK